MATVAEVHDIHLSGRNGKALTIPDDSMLEIRWRQPHGAESFWQIHPHPEIGSRGINSSNHDFIDELKHRAEQAEARCAVYQAQIVAAVEAMPASRRQHLLDAPLLDIVNETVSQMFWWQRRAEQAEAAIALDAEDELAWLVERGPQPEYWVRHGKATTTDPYKATHFARKQDAECEVDFFRLAAAGWRAVEHLFCRSMRNEIHRALKRLEFIGPIYGSQTCPACNWNRENGHDPKGCWLNAALALHESYEAAAESKEEQAMDGNGFPLCICGHSVAYHRINYVPGRRVERRGACRACGVAENGNLPCPAYQITPPRSENP